MFIMGNKIEFADWLKYQMEHAGIRSESELARRSNLTRSTINKTMRGISSPTPEVIRKIAIGLGVPYHEALQVAGVIPKTDNDPIIAECIDKLTELDAEDRKIVYDLVNSIAEKRGKYHAGATTT